MSTRTLVAAVLLVMLGGMLVLPLRAEDGEGRGKAKRNRERGDNIGDMMERLHEGRRSPMRQLETLGKQDKPAWDDVAKLLPGFSDMSKALEKAKSQDVRDASDTYVQAVKHMKEAVVKKDAALLKANVAALKESCSDCHKKGGPGGELD